MGSEIALDGAEDPGNRRRMEFAKDQSLITHISTLGALRKKYPALTRGDLEVLHEESGMAVYKRTYKDETLIIAINNSTKQQTVVIDKNDLPLDMELKGILADCKVKEHNGKYSIIIDSEQAEIFSIAEKKGLNFSLLGPLALIISVLLGMVILIWRKIYKIRLS